MPHQLPLRDIRILVGRAHHQAGALSAGLRKLGAGIIEIPFIEIRRPRSYQPLDGALANITTYDWLILSSVNGVEAVWDRLRKKRYTRTRLQNLKIAAIGPATQSAIEAHGLKVHVVPKEYVAEAVVRSLRRRIAGKRVLLARARVARDVIPRELRKLGAHVDVAEAYETVVPRSSRSRLLALLSDPKRSPHVITFTSSSTVRNFAHLAGNRVRHKLPRPHFASIGPVTSATLREFGLPVDIEAEKYTIPGLIKAIVEMRLAASRASTIP